MQFGEETLLLIPCCAEKRTEDAAGRVSGLSLADYLDWDVYLNLLSAREELLAFCQKNIEYSSSNYAKNQRVILGPDFGGSEKTGKYLQALQRYNGSFYKAEADWIDQVAQAIQSSISPRLLIISALYGVLHPFELIQDYNLQISDPPARNTWSNYLPEILGNYINNMKIKRVVLYFGKSTAYLKIAEMAVDPLLKKGKVEEVFHYDVENGNSYHTPHNHGLLLLRDLTGIERSGYTRIVNRRRLKSRK